MKKSEVLRRLKACGVIAGSDLTAGAKTGDYESIVRIGKELVAAVKSAG